MIYKVFYQNNFTEAPVRENTHSLYVEAASEREVRRKLADKQFNIEFVQGLTDKQLEFEKRSEDFQVENL
jgi:DNA-dependent RNA polymerase auxiliary subunit epsilon